MFDWVINTPLQHRLMFWYKFLMKLIHCIYENVNHTSSLKAKKANKNKDKEQNKQVKK